MDGEERLPFLDLHSPTRHVGDRPRQLVAKTPAGMTL